MGGTGHITRRMLLVIGGAAVTLGPASVRAAAGEAEITRILAGRTPKTAGLVLDVPSIAENGLVVPVNLSVASPMTMADHVRTIYLIAPDNPVPLVASFHFTPASGRAATSMRMRLAQTQTIIAIAELSNNELLIAKAEVKVTIGGCGG